MSTDSARAPLVRPEDQVDLFSADLPSVSPAPRRKATPTTRLAGAKSSAARPRVAKAGPAVPDQAQATGQAPATSVVPVPSAAARPSEAPVRANRQAGSLAVQFGASAELVVRDTFSMPKGDHAMIQQLRLRAAKAGHPVSKSEVVRAALVALSSASSERIVALLAGLEKVKPGRKG
jgi:hypothetical protein